jgi:uncharacterized protein
VKNNVALPRIFIDTSFIIALVNERDDYHTVAQTVADRYDGRSTIISDAILLEVANALSRGFKVEAIEIVEDFLSSEDVEVVRLTPELFDRAFSLYKTRQDKEWGLVDCFSFVIMSDRGISDALTFDKHFIQAGFNAIPLL